MKQEQTEQQKLVREVSVQERVIEILAKDLEKTEPPQEKPLLSPAAIGVKEEPIK